MKHKEALVGIPLLVTLALVAGIWIGYSFIPSDSRSGHPEAKVGEILDIISENYVDQVDLDSLIETTIPSMLENLDPHTAYIPAADLDEVNADLEGSFSGIGISFQVMNDTITVVEIISGGPSEKVGLMAGDRIVEVNDSTVAGTDITPDQVRALLRGAAGTQVKLGVMRNTSPDMLTYTVTRGDIPVTSIDASYMIEDRIGYIKVNKFGRNTYEEFYTEMLMLDRAGAKDIILDLRGNGGGFLDVAIRMANEFLNRDNLIVMTKGRDGELLFAAKSDGSGSFRNDRVVILIDEFSASASEIMAGAIQDNDRGIIIGRRSFGKGLVQQQINLADSSAMRVTTARYYTPSGRCIQKPWEKGHNDRYATEIYERYLAGEAFSADSVKFDDSMLFSTTTGRSVYGGGGIMPDIFVPSDTTNYTQYLTSVVNAGLLHRFAFEYTDRNRGKLDAATNSDELLRILPPDQELLSQFVAYAASNGVPARWYYINLSRPLLVNQLKALIARDALGVAAYYEIVNHRDNMVRRALEAIRSGEAEWPVKPKA
ncbi:MAG: S41 family peptidase [Muribaculaceae bacterium]|jgi:carboxyl-terminal processing protease|nr:S41 family peptidase [Muribaculaceae bacterium]